MKLYTLNVSARAIAEKIIAGITDDLSGDE